MKAKGPAAANAEVEKKKGLVLFRPRPPTPKLLRAFGGNTNFLEKMRVTTLPFLSRYVVMKAITVMLTDKHIIIFLP